jgi:ubiquinone/menaquinone biosynthesis C-methylase UbiE
MAGGLIEAEHRARYWWASGAVAGKEVLDAGCGTGYGLQVLRGVGPAKLVGVDTSEDAVARARKEVDRYAEIVQGDVRKLPFDDDAFDVVVCFEVIEHIEGHDEALGEMRRVLRAGGVLLISSPNPDVYPPGNPHHVHEFRREELESALKAHFHHVYLHQQHPWLATAITPLDTLGSDGLTSVRAGRIDPGLAPGGETYVLAVASDAPVARLEPVVLLGDDFEVGWWEAQLADTRRERDRTAKAERRACAETAAAREELAMLSQRILELEQEAARVVELEHRLVQVESTLEHREGAAFAEADYMAGVIEDMKDSVSWKITAPLRALKRLRR